VVYISLYLNGVIKCFQILTRWKNEIITIIDFISQLLAKKENFAII
jgi:hypothetical protein